MFFLPNVLLFICVLLFDHMGSIINIICILPSSSIYFLVVIIYHNGFCYYDYYRWWVLISHSIGQTPFTAIATVVMKETASLPFYFSFFLDYNKGTASCKKLLRCDTIDISISLSKGLNCSCSSIVSYLRPKGMLVLCPMRNITIFYISLINLGI